MFETKARKSDKRIISTITLRDGNSGCQKPACQATNHGGFFRLSFFMEDLAMIGYRNMARVYREMELNEEDEQVPTKELNELIYGYGSNPLEVDSETRD